MDWVVNIRMALIMFQTVLSVHCVSYSLKKRKYYVLRLILTSLAALLFAFFVTPPQDETTLGTLLSAGYFFLFFVIANICGYICYDTDFRASAFITVIAYTLQHSVYLVFSVFDQILIDNVAMTGWISYVFSRRFFWTILLVPLSVFSGRRIQKSPEIILPSSIIFAIAFATILSEMVISSFFKTSTLSTPLSTNPSFYATKIFNLMVCILILVLILTKADQNGMEKEMQYIKQFNAEQSRLYEVNKETMNLINLKAHDLKHQIRHLYKNNEIVSEESLHEMESILSIYDTNLKTGREALDVVVQEKALTCKNKNIDFRCMIDAKGLDAIHDNDIYSLFGNILDNAIEASQQCETDRWISLKIKMMGNLTMIQQENSFVGELEFKDSLPQTTKQDHDYHGFGVKSIRYIVQKYDGVLNMKANSGIFTCMISFERKE